MLSWFTKMKVVRLVNTAAARMLAKIYFSKVVKTVDLVGLKRIITAGVGRKWLPPLLALPEKSLSDFFSVQPLRPLCLCG